MSSPSVRLISSFSSKAKLLVTAAKLKQDLADLPCMVNVSDGTALEYLLLDKNLIGDRDVYGDRFTFESTKITMRYAFFPSEPSMRTRALRKFLITLAYLQGTYEIDAKDVFAHVAAVLAEISDIPKALNESTALETLQTRLSCLSDANASLSHELAFAEGNKASSMVQEKEQRHTAVIPTCKGWRASGIARITNAFGKIASSARTKNITATFKSAPGVRR